MENKVAIIGSRNLIVNDLEKYLPTQITEIVSGGAKGIDTCAKNYSMLNNIKLTEFLPNYKKFSKGAPIIRNLQIINYADQVVAFWDGTSKGTAYVINKCKELNIPIKVIIL